jgi:hypothetical protein
MSEANQSLNIKKVKLIFIFCIAMAYLIPYALIPFIFTLEQSPIATKKLISITLIGISTILLFLFFIPNSQERSKKVILDFRIVNKIIFSLFLLVVAVIFITAPSIPIIDSLLGNGNINLVQSREAFLKTRTGWEQGLNYLIGMITSYIVPYLIAYSHHHKLESRWKYTLIFCLYCISFLEKAYFLKAAIPLLIIYISASQKPVWLAIKGLSLIFVAFFAMYNLAGFGEFSESYSEDVFFSLNYSSGSTFGTIIWRAVAVPVLTAFDGMNIFITDFNNAFFYGRTSSLLAFFIGEKQVNFERYLYMTQFGGGGTGNANQFYILEAYINYGNFGVCFFSLFIGYFLMKSIRSKDLAYISIMPLFLYNLFNAGLIGNLFSNGYLLFFLMLSLIKFKK